MTITLIDSTNRAGSNTKTDSLDLKSELEAKTDPSEFGQLMSVILETRKSLEKTTLNQPAQADAAQEAVNGQEIAAQTPGQEFLKTIILGPHLNAITSETSAPDEQSLEAFARSQGLDETAIQWLMGTVIPVSAVTQTLPPESLKSLTSQALTHTSGFTEHSALAILTTHQSTAKNNPSPLVDNSTQAAVSNTAAPTPGGLLTSAALWAMAQPTEKALAHASKSDTVTEANDLQIHLMRSPPAAALWMQGNALVNSPVKETISHKTNVVISELDLSELVGDELLAKLAPISPDAQSLENATPGAPPSPLSGHPGQRMDLSTMTRQEAQNIQPATSEASTAQRSETIQNLSEKMGQAVGQRILSAIEKGQWHLKLMLRPATLGHIEVEIRMRSGELDAFFAAPQALTRELLQDGLSKLKDTLNQMGMDVASMQVGDGQTQQRGGDSTPSQTPKNTNSDSKESKFTETQQINIPRTKMGKDGWDVLV